MKHWIGVILTICFAGWMPRSIDAQDGSVPPLTQETVLQSDVGLMKMKYPEGWRSGNPFEVEATYLEIDNGSDTASPTAVVEVIIASYSSLPFAFDTRTENPAEAYFTGFRSERVKNQAGVYGNILPVLFGPSLSPFPGAMMMLYEQADTNAYLPDEPVISIGVGVAIAENSLLILSFSTNIRDFEGWRNTWLAMLDTLTWNDVPLMNTTTRQRTANLENSARMIELYDRQFAAAPESNISTLAMTIGIDAGTHQISIFPPNGWQYTLDDGVTIPIILSPINSTKVFAAIRWIPAGTAYAGLVIRDESPAAARLLLGTALVQDVRKLLQGGITEFTTFDWGGYTAAGVAYLFTSGIPNIRFLIAVPNDGFIEITLQAFPTEWVQVGIAFDYILSTLTLDGVLLDSEAAIEARKTLSIQ